MDKPQGQTILKKEDGLLLETKSGFLPIRVPGSLILTPEELMFTAKSGGKRLFSAEVKNILNAGSEPFNKGFHSLTILYRDGEAERTAKILHHPGYTAILASGMLERAREAYFSSWQQIIDEVRLGRRGSVFNDIDDLEKLAELHGKGILTDEEFAAKKKQLLGI